MNLANITAVIGRACGFGAATGLGVGGLLGTFDLPGLGSLLGAWCGAVVGGFAGALMGAALLPTRSLATARWVGALVSGLLAAAIMVAFGWAWVGPTPAVWSIRTLIPVLVVGTVAAVGGITAPRALGGVARGALPNIQRVLRVGALIGACTGVPVGLLTGLITYPPTAVFAGLEVGVFGTAIGVVLAVIVAGIDCLHRLCLAARTADRRPRPL